MEEKQKDVKEMLEEEIRSEIDDLNSMETGSESKSNAIEDLAKLYKLRIEESKVDWDVDEKYNRRLMDSEQQEFENTCKSSQMESESIQKANQLTEEKKDRYIKLGIDAAGIVLPLIFYGIWMRKGFKFEETGTYTSTTFRGLFNHFKPTKK